MIYGSLAGALLGGGEFCWNASNCSDMFGLQNVGETGIICGRSRSRRGGVFLEYITMQDAWDQIEAIPGYARKKSGIPKIREFLGLLGDPDREFQVIHVAGTNGKGSVCAFLTSMLCEAGIPAFPSL